MRFVELRRMPLGIEQTIPADPADIRLFGPEAVVARSKEFSDLLKEFWLAAGSRFWY
jgi:hypothetical protein